MPSFFGGYFSSCCTLSSFFRAAGVRAGWFGFGGFWVWISGVFLFAFDVWLVSGLYISTFFLVLIFRKKKEEIESKEAEYKYSSRGPEDSKGASNCAVNL
jgi:hypothetical protein